jgi:hypothetical protein
MIRQTDHPIPTHIVELSMMANTHGIADENRIG